MCLSSFSVHLLVTSIDQSYSTATRDLNLQRAEYVVIFLQLLLGEWNLSHWGSLYWLSRPSFFFFFSRFYMWHFFICNTFWPWKHFVMLSITCTMYVIVDFALSVINHVSPGAFLSLNPLSPRAFHFWQCLSSAHYMFRICSLPKCTHHQIFGTDRD